MSDTQEEIDTSATVSEDYSDSEDDGFFEGMSEEQKKLIQERLDSAQKQFKLFNANQKSQKIRDVIARVHNIDEKTADLAIQSCRGNELLAIKRLLDDDEYKTTVTDMASGKCDIDMNAIMYRDKNQEVREALAFDPDVESDNDGDAWELKTHTHKHSSHSHGSGNESDGDKSDGSYGPKHSHESRERRIPRLCLDDALIMLANLQAPENEKNVEETKIIPTSNEINESQSTEATHSDVTSISDKKSVSDKDSESTLIPENKKHSKKPKISIAKEKELFAALSGKKANKVSDDTLRQLGWSEARIKAFKNREKNPNQYYYRFNNPGEPQATGKWSAKDKALFLKLIKEKGVDYQWGIFSMQIPGRVGYQCSNYYRQLIKEGEIKDDNYTFDKNGKLVFKFRDSEGHSTLVRQKRSGDSSSTSTPRKRKRVRIDRIERLQENEEISIPQPEVNVLPDYIDPMTMMTVEKPAISPYGHVMGYDSWLKVLNRNPRNTCPFTKKHLTRRSLVKLTEDNIEEYRDKIIPANGFEEELHINN